MVDFAIFINTAGNNFNLKNLIECILSFQRNMGTKNYSFWIVTDNENNANNIKLLYNTLDLKGSESRLIISSKSWADNFNDFATFWVPNAKFLIISHDDVYLKTPGLGDRIMSYSKSVTDKLGFISFTCRTYYESLGIFVSSAREMFAIDRANYPLTFELHNQRGDYFDKDSLDFPKSLCRVPGVYSHLIVVPSGSMIKLGRAPNWGPYTLLLDEHYSNRALCVGLWSAWEPSVEIDHPLRGEERTFKGIKNQLETEILFKKTWGYNYLTPLTSEVVSSVLENHPSTNLGFFADRLTYDYVYF